MVILAASQAILRVTVQNILLKFKQVANHIQANKCLANFILPKSSRNQNQPDFFVYFHCLLIQFKHLWIFIVYFSL